MNYLNLFFDLDRTLWDYDANSAQALDQIFTEFELNTIFSSTEELLDKYIKNNDTLWVEYRNGKIRKEELRSKRFHLTLLENNTNDPELAARIGERYMYITPRLTNLIPNCLETLDYLRNKKYNLYILTNGFENTQNEKMRNSKIDQYFVKMFSSEKIRISKPHKDIFHWAISSIHANKRSCLMIGDDLQVDIRGAMHYGIDAVWLNSQGMKSEFNPSYVISDLAELRTIL